MVDVLKIIFYYCVNGFSINFQYLIEFSVISKEKALSAAIKWCIVLGGFKDNWEMTIVYFKTNFICYTCYYLYWLSYVLLYHVVFYWSKTIGTIEITDNSHLVGKISSQS